VSSAAVSLGLRNSPRVSEALRARIVALARSSGYIPNVRVAELMSEIRKGRRPEYRATLAAFSLYAAERPWEERPYLKEMLDAAIATAAMHGYRMEYFWLKRPGLTVSRFCAIMRARGIEGLFCLGSYDTAETLPPLLRQFAIVAQGPSIAEKLHRVLTNSSGDARRLMGELLRRGYRRPGFALVSSGDVRGLFVYSSTFLGYQERGEVEPPHVPILRAETWNEAQFGAWFDQHRPDVIVLHHLVPFLRELVAWLKRRRINVPEHVGLALLNSGEELDPGHAGIFQRGATCGALAAEMLMARVHLRDFGPVVTPKTELFDGVWREGRSLRPSG
jgi:LacI family transcriptional regulator